MSSQFPQKFGKYILLRKIAMGGMAEIFRAKTVGAEGFEKDIVIKRILPHYTEDEDFVKMFIDEASIAAKLQHANITQIFDFNVEHGSYYIAMEYVEGKDLKKVMEDGVQKNQPLAPAQCAWLVMEVAKGLHYAHTKSHKGKPLNIVHRDISPQNAMVSYNGEVKLMDFGIAKAASRSTKTVAGTVKGKCAYMSPEQARGKPLDGRSDLFALGVVLWEMLTHKRLFLGDSDFVTLSNVLKQEAPPPSSLNPAVPPELDAIVLKALSKDREDRQETVEHFNRELTKWFYATVDDLDAVALKPWMHKLFDEDINDLQEMMQQERTMAISLADSPGGGAVNPEDATVALSLGNSDPHGAKTILDDSELNAEKVREALAAAGINPGASTRAMPASQSTGAVATAGTGAVASASGGKGWLVGLLVLLLIGGGGFVTWYLLQDGADNPKPDTVEVDPKKKTPKDGKDKPNIKSTDKTDPDDPSGVAKTVKPGDPDPTGTVAKDLASLTVNVEPADAENVVVYNGSNQVTRKLTNLKLNDKIRLKVNATGYEEFKTDVVIDKKDQTVKVVLKKQLKKVSVVLQTNDKEATIKVDGKATGEKGGAKLSGPVGTKFKLEATPSKGGPAKTREVTLEEKMPLVIDWKIVDEGPGLVALTVKCSVKNAKVDATPGNVVVKEDGTVLVEGLLVGASVKVSCKRGSKLGRKEITIASADQELDIAMRETTAPKGPCKISIVGKPWAKCSVGGKGPKTTRFTVELMGPKTYTVVCKKNTATKKKSVRCKPNKSHTVTFDFR